MKTSSPKPGQHGSPAPAAPSPVKYKLSVAARAVAAIAGGYALSSLAAAALALWLPLTRDEAVLAGGMAAFVLYPVAVVWVFLASSARRAWLGLVLPAAILGALVWWLRGGLS